MATRAMLEIAEQDAAAYVEADWGTRLTAAEGLAATSSVSRREHS